MANRLCKLALSNAFDNIKAAISKIMTWLPNDDAASLCDSTPNKGNNAKGKSEVAGIGSASVTHKMATNSVMDAVKICRWVVLQPKALGHLIPTQ